MIYNRWVCFFILFFAFKFCRCKMIFAFVYILHTRIFLAFDPFPFILESLFSFCLFSSVCEGGGQPSPHNINKHIIQTSSNWNSLMMFIFCLCCLRYMWKEKSEYFVAYCEFFGIMFVVWIEVRNVVKCIFTSFYVGWIASRLYFAVFWYYGGVCVNKPDSNVVQKYVSLLILLLFGMIYGKYYKFSYY